MNTFQMKEVSKESEDGLLRVTRMRTTNGSASIIITAGKTSITLSNGDESYGNEYEQRAKDLAEMIDAIANEPCLIG